MTEYIILLAAVVITGIPLCSSKCGKIGRIAYCVGFAAVFIYLSSVRFQVGYDYNSYGRAYFDMKYMDIEEVSAQRMEKGFIMPLYVLNLAFEDYRAVFIYTSIIIYSAVFYLIGKNSSKPWISVAAYLCFGLFFNSLCFLRQVIAALICAYATKYIDENNPFKFAVLIIAASSFHWSALLMLAMYIFLKIKPNPVYLVIVSAGTIIFCIISKSLMKWAVNNFYMYSMYDPEKSVEAGQGLPISYTIMFGVLFAVAFAFRKRLMEKNRRNSVYINCLMFTVVFEAMGTRHAILSRFALIVYLTPILFLVPDLVQVIKEYITEKIKAENKCRAVKICTSAAGSIFAVFCYAMLMVNNYNGTVPYVSQKNRPYDIFVEQVIEFEDDFDEEWDEEWDDEDWDNEEWEDEELIEEEIMS